MKAMLSSDLLNFRQSIRSILFLVILFGGMSIFSRDTAFLGILVVVLCLTMPFHLFGYDAAYGWDKLTLSLPISRTNVIISKYLICAGVMAIMMVLSATSIGLYQIYQQEDVLPQLTVLIANGISALLLLSVMLPIIVKFGVTKGRYILIGVVWLPIMILFFLKNNHTVRGFINNLDQYLETTNLFPVALIALIAVSLLYVVSAEISIAIYKRKEL